VSATRRFTLGLTGGIASGKSVVADHLAELGAAIVDTDMIAREQTAPGRPAVEEIAGEFGASLVARNGALDRAALREKVFADRDARKRLEAILHPRIRRAAWERARATPGSYLVMVIPLLAETGFSAGIDRVLVIDAPRKLQMERLRARDGITGKLARAIIAAQASRRQRRALANDIILNDGSIEALRAQANHLHPLYLGENKARNREKR